MWKEIVVLAKGYRSSLISSEKGKFHPYFGADTIYNCTFTSYERLDDSDGHIWPLPKSLRHLNSGGSFSVSKAYVETGGSQVHIASSTPGVGIWQEYTGPVYAWLYNYKCSGADIHAVIPSGQMNAWGTTGIARSTPTNPLANMGVFLGEIHETKRLVKDLNLKEQARFWRNAYKSKAVRLGSKRAADNWLSLQFGWFPFIKDLRDAFNVTTKLSKHIDHYSRNSGRTIRRRRDVYNNSDTTVTNIAGDYYPVPAVSAPLFTASGKVVKTVENHYKVWFSGAFTYYLPDAGTFWGRAQRVEAQMAHLYGLRINPELVWNLVPWSWLDDWVTNAGDVFHNWSAFSSDGLVMKYGYVMAHTWVKTTYTLSGHKARLGSVPSVLSQSFISERKQRAYATPYGFGLDGNSFSSRQWSIIAALGISRKPRAYIQ